MTLADRAPAALTFLAAAGVTAALASAFLRTPCPHRTQVAEPEQSVRVELRSRGCLSHAPVVDSSCPAAVRATMHVGPDAALHCVRVEEHGEPFLFATARYTTTEAWERVAIVTLDGATLASPLEDRPVVHAGR
jgi:hypothetical protein